MIAEAAGKRFGIDPKLVEAFIETESGGDPSARNPTGATGLMQLMPDTAKEMGVTDVSDPVQNVMGGVRYFRSMLDRYKGDYVRATAAYNAGPGNVDKYGGIPPFQETQDYVRKIGKAYSQASGQPLGGTQQQPPFGGGFPTPARPAAPPSWLAGQQYLEDFGVEKATPEMLKNATAAANKLGPWFSAIGTNHANSQ
jgi:hypothetical protein